MEAIKNKEGKTSKFKLGSVIGGVALALGTLASMLQGDLNFLSGAQRLAMEVAGVFTLLGFRDIPFLNVFKK